MLDNVASLFFILDNVIFSSLSFLDDLTVVDELDELVFSEGSFEGRDLRCGFFGRAIVVFLMELLLDTLSSRLRRLNEALLLRGLPSNSEPVEFLLRPSFGDFGLVVGIYISNIQKLKLFISNDKDREIKKSLVQIRGRGFQIESLKNHDIDVAV